MPSTLQLYAKAGMFANTNKHKRKCFMRKCFISSEIIKGRNCSVAFPLRRYRQAPITIEKHKQSTPLRTWTCRRLFSLYIILAVYIGARTRTWSPSYIKKYLTRAGTPRLKLVVVLAARRRQATCKVGWSSVGRPCSDVRTRAAPSAVDQRFASGSILIS